MMYGRIEADLHRPELARENFQRAQGLLEHWAEHIGPSTAEGPIHPTLAG